MVSKVEDARFDPDCDRTQELQDCSLALYPLSFFFNCKNLIKVWGRVQEDMERYSTYLRQEIREEHVELLNKKQLDRIRSKFYTFKNYLNMNYCSATVIL